MGAPAPPLARAVGAGHLAEAGPAFIHVMIPKVFHRIWIGGPMPEEFRANGQSWLDQNPDWELREWGDGDLGWLQTRDLYDQAHILAPERYVQRFRSNLARYEILARYGGVYVDCDTRALSPIGPHIEGLAAFAAEERTGVIGNTVLGATPGHPFFVRLVERVRESVLQHAGERSPVSCGPLYVTRTWETSPEGLDVVPTRLFYPQHWSEIGSTADLTGAVCHHAWAALRGQVSVIMPWFGGCPHREAAREWVRARMSGDPSVQIVESAPSNGRWSRAGAVTNGIAKTFGDVVVVSDTDVWCDGLQDAIDRVRAGAPWAVPHHLVHRLSETATNAVLSGMEPEEAARRYGYDEAPYPGVLGGGLVVLARRTLLDIPPDPRFVEWGQEDVAWGTALKALAGDPWRGESPLWHLWHPHPERLNRRVGNEANNALAGRYEAARYSRHQMAALVREAHPNAAPAVTGATSADYTPTPTNGTMSNKSDPKSGPWVPAHKRGGMARAQWEREGVETASAAPAPERATAGLQANLASMTAAELKALAKERGLSGYSSMTKADLIKGLQ